MICKIENCERKVLAKELCCKHYYFYLNRRRKGIPFDWPFGKLYNNKRSRTICKIDDCDKVVQAKGYCPFHWYRIKHKISLDKPKGLKGELNHNWKGGVADYPNHWTMKKNRLIKIEQEKGKCEICNCKATKIHHKDGSRDNHAIENLKLLCNKCHGRVHRGRKVKTSIWIRRYGSTAKDLCKKLNCCYQTLINWHKNGDIRYFLG